MKRSILAGLGAVAIIIAFLAFQSGSKPRKSAPLVSVPNAKHAVGKTFRPGSKLPSLKETMRVSSSDFDPPSEKFSHEEIRSGDDFADIMAELEPETTGRIPVPQYEVTEIRYFMDYLAAVALDDAMESPSRSQAGVIDLEELSRSNLDSLAQELINGEADDELEWRF
jgi:hypothetical protein